MRKLGDLPTERDARTFGDALFVRGIENDVEPEDDGAFSIWVHEDDRRDDAMELLRQFRDAPDSAEWHGAGTEAVKKRRVQEKEDARRKSRVVTREKMDLERSARAVPWLPMLLAGISVVLTALAGELSFMPSGWMPSDRRSESAEETEAVKRTLALRMALAMTEWRVPSTPEALAALAADFERSGGRESLAVLHHYYDLSLPEIRHGQIWRLVSSIFVHYGIMHLLFNLMWLRDLGGFIQRRLGAGYLAALVALGAIVSNYLQLWWSGPGAGGLSGVNYALFGFMWVRGKIDRSGAWEMNPQVVQIMMIWFFLCFTPIIPMVANAAHASGLLFGMAAGFVTATLAARGRGV